MSVRTLRTCLDAYIDEEYANTVALLNERAAAFERATTSEITDRLCRLIWKILHKRVRYEERGPAVSEEAKKVRARAR